MQRREWKSRLIVMAVVLAWCSAAQAADRLNVLFILTEDQGWHLGHVGTPGLQTPNLDQLCESGVFFRNAYVAYPVCSASKAAIMTGLHNHTNGLLNNTANYHKPAAQLTSAERQLRVYVANRIRDEYPTLTELLRAAGYYQGVSHKLHLSPNERFPYDEFLKNPTGKSLEQFIERARQRDQPWFFLFNVPNPHRPYPDSHSQPIRVDPAMIELPSYLPDTPVIRTEWAEYLAAIEQADAIVGDGLEALKASGENKRTIVVYLSDHGACYQHGKMSLYEAGLRVPLLIRGPGIETGDTDALASELDLMPTLLELLEIESPNLSHGKSLVSVLKEPAATGPRDYVYAEISHRGPLPNDGLQERSVCDGGWKLIYRENVDSNWRQVNADLKDFRPWRNRTYQEVLRVRDQHPEAFRVLAEMDPQSLGGELHRLELYDLENDPDEMHNLVGEQKFEPQLTRLYGALREWVDETADPAVSPPELQALLN